MLSKRDIAVLLDDQLNDFAVNVTFKSVGPGYLDPWLVMQKRKNIWQHIEPAQTSTDRKKIIFSIPDTGTNLTSPFAIAFFAALVQFYDVYIWPGEDSPLRDIRPISTAEEFWSKVNNTHPATSEAVKTSLGYQGLTADNFIILDYKKYSDAIQKWIGTYRATSQLLTERAANELNNYLADTLDLRYFDLNQLNNISTKTIRTHIKTVLTTCPNKQEIFQLRLLFPNLTTIEIRGANDDYVKQHLHLLNGLSVVLSDYHHEEEFILPGNINLKKLTLKKYGTDPLKKFSAEPSARLEGLELVNCGEIECDVVNLTLLYSLRFIDCNGFKLTTARRNQINELSLIHCLSMSNIDFTRLPALKRFELKGPGCNGAVNIGNTNWLEKALLKLGFDIAPLVPQIEHLELQGHQCTYHHHIDLTRDLALKSVAIERQNEWHITLPAYPFEQKDKVSPSPINVSEPYPGGIEAWSIDGIKYTDLASIPSASSIKYLRIDNVDLSTNQLMLAQFDQLETLILTNTKIGEVNINSNRFKQLSVIDYASGDQFRVVSKTRSPINKITLDLPGYKEIFVDLDGCEQLNSLTINAGTNRISLSNVHHCQKLRSVRIKSCNADMLKNVMMLSIPADCVVSAKQSVANNYSADLPVDGESCDVWPFNKCAGSSSDVSSESARSNAIVNCSPTGRKIALGVSGIGLGALATYIITCLILKINPLTFEHWQTDTDDSNTITTEPTNPTPAPAPTPPSNPSSNLYLYLGIAGGTALLLLLAGILIYRYRFRSNNAAPTELDYNSYGGIALDAKTWVNDTDRKYSGQFKYNFFTGGKVDLERVRLQVQNSVKYENGRLIFYTDQTNLHVVDVQQFPLESDNIVIQRLMDNIQRTRETTLGYFEGEIEKGILYPLPSLETIESEANLLGIYADPIDAVEFSYNDSTQQYYFKLKDNADSLVFSQNVKFFYHLKQNPYYLKKDYLDEAPALIDIEAPATNQLAMARPETLLPSVLHDALTRSLKDFAPLRFVFDDTISVWEKLQKLVNYFQTCKCEALRPNPSNPIDNLLAIIKQKKGVCRHCSEGFFAMARLIGVPVVSTYNNRHMFCAIPFMDGGKIRYQRVDLTLPDNAPEQDISDVFDQILKLLLGQANQYLDAHPEVAEELEAYKRYHQSFEDTVKVDELHTIKQLLEKEQQLFSPLIELTHDQDPYKVNQQIAKHLKALRFDITTQHIFIDSPEEFDAYLYPDVIRNGEQLTENGPLRNFLLSIDKPCVLVINWTNFTPKQQASYQSLIDTIPMLSIRDETIKVSKKVTVVGITRNSSVAGRAFVSRTKRWHLHDDFFNEPGVSLIVDNSPKQPESGPIEIDLFNRPAWREELYGEIAYHGRNTLLQEGALLKAIRENRPLMIFNPPNDHDFQLLMHHINEERKFYYNGETISIPKNVTIQTQKRTNTIKSDNVFVYSDVSQKRPLIHIGIHNLHQLYKQLIINKDGTADTVLGGLLERYNPETEAFCLTGPIPYSYWQALTTHITKRYPTKVFHFCLAPGAAIENVAAGEAPNKPVKVNLDDLLHSDFNIIASNDTDFVTKNIAKELRDPLVIYISAKTTYNDLIEIITRDERLRTFKHDHKGLLDALIDGRNVILSGEMSIALYYQLYPLFTKQPYIVVNGNKINVSNRLIAVMPTHAKENIPTIQAECHFDTKEYRFYLSKHPHFNDINLYRIELFYMLAAKLPHRGQGRPTAPRMSYHHTAMMLDELAKRDHLHHHNPIKGLFNYDYPRRSEDQSYLNVLGKYFFNRGDKTPARQSKLRHIIKQFTIDNAEKLKNQLWSILNCFNGAELYELLGENFTAMVRGQGYPALPNELLEKLFDHCQHVINAPTKEEIKKTSRNEKHLYQLGQLLADVSKPVLFLKGEPGVGKTYTVRCLIGKYYEGEAELLEWLTADADKVPDDQAIAYLYDEANMLPPGALDAIIKGLSSPDRIVYYNGKEYKLSVKHKLILTGNPEDFPNRFYHQAIQDFSETIYFEKPDDEFLRKIIYDKLPQRLRKYSEHLLFAYHLIEQYNPFFATSIRDIENLCVRFTYLARTSDADNDATIKNDLLKACIGEFAGAIYNRFERDRFISELAAHIGVRSKDYLTAHDQSVKPLTYITDEVSITKEKAYLIDAIEQDLAMRFQALLDLARNPQDKQGNSPRLFGNPTSSDTFNKSSAVYLKQAVIVEGDPGLGKSTILRAIVEKYRQGLRQRQNQLTMQLNKLSSLTKDHFDLSIELEVINKELSRYVYEISVGSANSAAMLKRALEDEAIIIGDEANVDPDLEAVLNQYLSGVDEDKRPVSKLFMWLGSQNSSAHEGRPDASQAVRNRTHFIYMDEFAKHEYESFATANFIGHPKQFVNAYLDVRKDYPSTNTRTFHNVLKAEFKRNLLQVVIDDQYGESAHIEHVDIRPLDDSTPLLNNHFDLRMST